MSPLIAVAEHTALIYLFLLLMLRFVSTRQLGQLSVVDIVVVILLGSAVETAMVNGNTTLWAGIVSASTLLVINRLLTAVFLRFRRLRHLVSHGPVLLVHDGQFVEENLRRIGFTKADVLEACRERECADVSTVKFAVLEADGTINIIPEEAQVRSGRIKKSSDASPLPTN